MRKIFALLLILSFLTASCIATSLPVKADYTTIIVPDDYATLEAAVQHASSGDTIYVRSGRHKISNDTLIINKALSIIGEDVTSTFLIGPGYGYEFFPYPSSTEVDMRMYTLLSGGVAPANFIPPPKAAIQVNADNFRISHVTIEKCDIGITINGDETIVTHTKMPSASVTGSHALMSDNTIISISVKGDYQNITRNYGGISFTGSFSYIAKNMAESDLSLEGSFNVIARNSFSTIYMGHAHSNIICNNSLSCLWVGFYGHCSNNTVCRNRFSGPGLWGILMGTGSYNVFHDNLISNYGYGIAIGGNHLVAEHNTFCRNILMNNSRHVSANWEILGAGNLWDNGEVGNYWDDYTGTDSNGDGIGDIPYLVEGCKWDDATGGHVSFVFGQDNYPLMAPFDIDSVSIELPAWASPSSDPSLEPQPENTKLSPSPETETEPNPFPTLPVLAASAVAAVATTIVLVYFKKRHENRE